MPGTEYATKDQIIAEEEAINRTAGKPSPVTTRLMQSYLPFSAHMNDCFCKATVILCPSRRNRKRNSYRTVPAGAE